MNDPQQSGAAAAPYPGQALGLPENGPGSIAGWGRRISALTVDWLASTLVVIGFLGFDSWSRDNQSGWVTLLVFLVETTVLTALTGGSFGQLITRIAVVRLDGQPVNLLQAFVRTLLICLVIPPLVFTREGRGLHDLAVKTVALRR